MEKSTAIKKWEPIITSIFDELQNKFLIEFICIYSEEYNILESTTYANTGVTLGPIFNTTLGSGDPVNKLPGKLDEIKCKLNNIEKIKIDPNEIFYDPIKDKLDFKLKSTEIDYSYYESVDFINEIFGEIGLSVFKKHYKSKYRLYKLNTILN